MDRILIEDLAARCIVGVNPEERRERQDVVLQLELATELGLAGRSDRLEDSVDYKVVKKRVLALVEESRFHLLEALAEAVAAACLQEPRIHEVRVRVAKPGALRFARSVAVELVRQRG